ncbi:dTDP-4-dehydrorhamnose reductase [Iodidimonas sp. MBR-14]|uniref:dTDP-4-dehydrorhamnose reductase n=1 Tax=Iodidimonas sp. MBR-14 TaxID=3032319 RepID=UPI0024826D07|nr:dTDP-4-dehydrorhamnose reductase [Iodidimonas sp. MBR-14]
MTAPPENSAPTRVLITGAAGQLGRELCRTAPDHMQVQALDRAALDILEPAAILDALKQHQPHLIINAAAYTAVDQAESEPEKAFAINAKGPENLALAASRHGVRLIHLSTDFVFDGKAGSPYAPKAETHPINLYGLSKRAGEQAVERLAPQNSLILRTSWLYSAHGSNFVKTMLRLMKEGRSLRVIADQVGTPCWALGLAEALWKLADLRASGLLHWGDAGVASWYDFAVAIMEEAQISGLLDQSPIITPVTSADYQTAARRPSYSVLDRSRAWALVGTPPLHWRAALRLMLQELA